MRAVLFGKQDDPCVLSPQDSGCYRRARGLGAWLRPWLIPVSTWPSSSPPTPQFPLCKNISLDVDSPPFICGGSKECSLLESCGAGSLQPDC